MTSISGIAPRAGELTKAQSGETVMQALRRDWMLYAMLAPALIWFLVFLYQPMYGLQIAFKQFSAFKGIEGSPWIGFGHFVTLFESDQFRQAIWNTLVISFYSLIFAAPVPILLALMVNEVQQKGVRKSIQTAIYLPHFISIVVVAGIVVALLSPTSGLVNNALAALGFDRTYFLTRPEWFRTIFIGSGIWKEAGFDSIIYLAAIMGINPALYESAQVDGATRWQMMWRITLPSIVPTIAVLMVIKLGNILEVGYEYIILLYQPTTYETADVISTYIYRLGLQGARYDLAAAAGIFNAVVALVLVLVANKISRRITRTGVF
ncbi:ABC transporter permease [Piscinibacter sakaiensis]|uniref:ABC transporter permease n=1 Tax=Piscinibacter sakaiensis TaxID=1547922 RepID=UPI003AB0D5E3